VLAVIAVATIIAAVIQRVTGLAFVLVLIGPVVLAYGPVEGVTIALFLAVIASLFAVPGAWRDVDWSCCCAPGRAPSSCSGERRRPFSPDLPSRGDSLGPCPARARSASSSASCGRWSL